MQWQSLGFRGDVLNTDPILKDTLRLYTGHEDEIRSCFSILSGQNIRIVIEGSRGVGTTSFANYLRFSLQEKQLYFTPRNEIRVESGWRLETLLAVIVANIVREIELFGVDSMLKDKRFQNAKALSLRIAETYRSFGLEAFGFGLNYDRNAAMTQPVIVPSTVLGHHLEDLAKMIQSMGYANGVLIQLNNLDIGEIHEEAQIKQLFNSLRDYAQTNLVSWLFVGDVGLRKFIAQQVDRLDDIISFEVEIHPLGKKEFAALVEKRIEFYRANDKVELPIEMEVFSYLYEITKGRLRYVFGLLSRLMATLRVGDLTDRITLEIAKPTLMKLARARVEKNNLSPGEEQVLRQLVFVHEATASVIAKQFKQSSQYTGRVLNKLANKKLVVVRKHGVNRYYRPVLDAVIAYK